MKSCFVFFLAFKRKIMSSFHKILNSMFTLQGCLICLTLALRWACDAYVR